MVNCKFCNMPTRQTNTQLCQKCYTYFVLEEEKVYPIPPKGEVHHTEKGKIICHICGKAFYKLGNHIYYSHHITAKEYKEEFELRYNIKLTSQEYQKVMRQHAFNNDMDKNLKKWGKNTRFKRGKGQSRRVSSQEILERRARKNG